ncbi:hypothetical protein JTB14_035781 [Gonioctena quinquepunctata]|nr:hypothetical protein JTB14_035781 [Gonioctena quinquepunctata]
MKETQEAEVKTLAQHSNYIGQTYSCDRKDKKGTGSYNPAPKIRSPADYPYQTKMNNWTTHPWRKIPQERVWRKTPPTNCIPPQRTQFF